jgi:AcrR family transcriptional regulator
MASRVTQRADARRNRERLLAAAETAFNAQGAGASLDDIAKAAGVGNATLYRHFPTRAKLLEAVYDQRIAELCAAAAELAQPTAPARALHEWLRAVVAHVTDRRVLTDAFLAAYAGPPGTEPPQFAAWHDALFEAGRPLLAAAQDAGTARRDLDIAEVLALVTGVARAGSPAQADRFLGVLLEGITPRLFEKGTDAVRPVRKHPEFCPYGTRGSIGVCAWVPQGQSVAGRGAARTIEACMRATGPESSGLAAHEARCQPGKMFRRAAALLFAGESFPG